MKKIKVEMLTREAFAPFGEVLTPEGRKMCIRDRFKDPKTKSFIGTMSFLLII